MHAVGVEREFHERTGDPKSGAVPQDGGSAQRITLLTRMTTQLLWWYLVALAVFKQTGPTLLWILIGLYFLIAFYLICQLNCINLLLKATRN